MGAYIPIGDSSVEIKRMRVEPANQKNGIGKQILNALELEAKKMDLVMWFLRQPGSKRLRKLFMSAAGILYRTNRCWAGLR